MALVLHRLGRFLFRPIAVWNLRSARSQFWQRTILTTSPFDRLVIEYLLGKLGGADHTRLLLTPLNHPSCIPAVLVMMLSTWLEQMDVNLVAFRYRVNALDTQKACACLVIEEVRNPALRVVLEAPCTFVLISFSSPFVRFVSFEALLKAVSERG